MEKEEMKYEQAVRELEEIVERMENDELDIDQLSEQLKRAKTLVKLCKDKLTKTDEEIKKLLSEDWFTISRNLNFRTRISRIFFVASNGYSFFWERKNPNP